jgi:hypothetical protein
MDVDYETSNIDPIVQYSSHIHLWTDFNSHIWTKFDAGLSNGINPSSPNLLISSLKLIIYKRHPLSHSYTLSVFRTGQVEQNWSFHVICNSKAVRSHNMYSGTLLKWSWEWCVSTIIWASHGIQKKGTSDYEAGGEMVKSKASIRKRPLDVTTTLTPVSTLILPPSSKAHDYPPCHRHSHCFPLPVISLCMV